MFKNSVQSDQLYKWSDINGRKVSKIAPAETKSTPARTASLAGHIAWIAYRAIQALRQAWMQMCGRTWSWSQVLPVHQPRREKTGDGLHPRRPPGKGGRIFGKLPQGKRDLQRTLCHQPRAFTPQGAFLGGPHATFRSQCKLTVSHQCWGDSNYLCQHAGTRDAIRFWHIRGGDA